MNEFKDQSQLQDYVKTHKRNGQVIGLIPTMGNLHEGHLCLVDAAKSLCDIVIVSIFVNPMQFGPDEDLDNYPRTLDMDQKLLSQRGANGVFIPSTDQIYPDGLETETRITVPQISEGLCSQQRPGHFEGVATVVMKFFHLCQPDLAFFGEKDFQQLKLIEKMASDLCVPIKVVGVPTVRAPDGLALSSRNHYLSEAERLIAPKLYQTLNMAADQISQADSDPKEIISLAYTQLNSLGFKVDYLELRREKDLKTPQPEDKALILLVAANLGSARLLDNKRLTLKS